jgi:3-methyladenine DNA glycosylase AlkD
MHEILVNEIIQKLKSFSNEKVLKSQQKFGINTQQCLGVTMPNVRLVAKDYKKNNPLALALWQTKIHEVRIAATLIAEPKLLSIQQINNWILDFNSWDLCDQCCSNLFVKTIHCNYIIQNYKSHENEFAKRTTFSLIAYMAVHLKKEKDQTFIDLLPLLLQHSNDNRNFVKKAINWALRQIGKRNENLLAHAINTAEEIFATKHKSAQFIAKNALQEFKTKFPNHFK